MTIELAAAPMFAYLLASVRIIAWLFVVPPFNQRGIPAPAKTVLGFGLALAATPANPDSIPTGAIGLMSEVAIQVLIGVGLGFVAMLLLSAITAAGQLIDIFGGFSLSTAYDPMMLTNNTVFGKFYQYLGTVLLFVTGGYLFLIGGLVKTFEFLPIGELPDLSATGPSELATAFSTFFVIAVQLALPMIAVLIVADIGLALLTKVSPMLNALGFLFPAKIGLVLMLIGLSFPMLPDASEKLVELINSSASRFSGGGG